jgi:hypothetical protein
MRAFVVAVFACTVGTTACSLPCGTPGLGNCRYDGDDGTVSDPDEGEEPVLCQAADTEIEFDGVGPVCEFSIADCSDGNLYEISCDTATTCECRLSAASGNVTTTNFTIEAACTEFSTSDSVRFENFASTNCGFDIDL